MLYRIKSPLSSLLLPALVFAVSALALAWGQAARADSQPAIWTVQSKNATVYMMGSMHFGSEDFYPLPREVQGAFEQSSTLVVEVDISRLSPSKAMMALFKYGRMPEGQTLKSQLSPKVYKKLSKVVTERGLPMSAFENFQPWFTAMQLVEAEIKKSELKQHLGIDMYFLSMAKDKQVVELESIESQLSMFGDLSIEQQESFLEQTLDDLGQSGDYLKGMAESWRTGDLATLESSLIAPFKHNKQSKALYKTIFTDRNKSMSKAVEGLLKQGGSSFFVVGAGHFVGDDGIIAQLKSKGLKPQRMTFETASETKKQKLEDKTQN